MGYRILHQRDFRDTLDSAVDIDLDLTRARLFDCNSGNRIHQ